MSTSASTPRERAGWGSISKIADNKYRLRLSPSTGKPRSAGVFPSKIAAEKERARLYVEHEYGVQLPKDGKRHSTAEHVNGELSEGQAATEMTVQGWVDRVEPLRKKKLSQEHYAHEQRWLLPILEAFGKEPLKDITAQDVEDWWLNLDTTPSNRRSIYSTLSAHMRLARKQGRISVNPCQVEGAWNKVSKDRLRHRPEDFWKVMEHVPSSLWMLFVLSANIHLRPGEARGLNVGDYDWTTHDVHIQRRATHRLHRGDKPLAIPKNHSEGYVKVSADLVPDMEAWLTSLQDQRASAPMFPGVKVPRVTSYYVDKHWHRAVEAVGFSTAEWHVHDLRAIGITQLSESGAAVKDIMRRSRHRTWQGIKPYLRGDSIRDAEVTLKYGDWMHADVQKAKRDAEAEGPEDDDGCAPMPAMA